MRFEEMDDLGTLLAYRKTEVLSGCEETDIDDTRGSHQFLQCSDEEA